MTEIPSRRQARAEQTRQKILSAAEKHFSLLGFYGARIDEIAAEAGVNKRMIYEYFGNKEDLYKIVLRKVYLLLGNSEEMLFSGLSEAAPAKAIRLLVELYFSFLHQNPHYVRMLMWENLNEGQYFTEMNMGESRDPLKKALHAILKRGQEAGIFRKELDEKHVLMTLFACPFNYFSNRYTMQRIMETDFTSPAEIESRISFTTDLLLTYLTAPAANRSQEVQSDAGNQMPQMQ